MKNWLKAFNLCHPFVIVGLCSAENQEQVLKIAHELKDSNASVFYSAFLKPHIRSSAFEEVGEVGLKWLKKVKEETGLLVGTEVVDVAQVKLALEYEIDILCIGGGITVDPFVVKEIADALHGTKKIVLIKIPMNSDLSLWLRAIEHLYNAKIEKLGFIHSRFSTYDKKKYKDNSEWQIGIELQSKFPNLPLLIEPSHITSDHTMILEEIQYALDLNYDGMIIEIDIYPENARNDTAQKIVPEALKQILKDLQITKQNITLSKYTQKMNQVLSILLSWAHPYWMI